jgi:hypothetical protein
MAQQKLGQSMASPEQSSANVFAAAEQIAGGLLPVNGR